MLGPIVLLASLAGGSSAEDAVREMQRSHIEANVPPPADFHRLLRRDLKRYFRVTSSAPSVTYEMLRDEPTQSGLAYPKFYLWITVVDGSTTTEGAVRVSAIDRERFEVTTFVSAADARTNPDTLATIFPAPVCARIQTKLAKR